MTRLNSNGHLTDVDRLTLFHRKAEIDRFFNGPWVTLYQSERSETHSVGRFSALIAKKAVPRVLQAHGWDLRIGEGLPGYVIKNGKVGYERFSDDGIEPIVILRSFCGMKPETIEIIEEFRHFHNLYWDSRAGRLVRIDETGDDETVAEIAAGLVRVRKPALTAFMAAKQMHLALFFEFDEMLSGPANPVSERDRSEDYSGPDRTWVRYMTNLDDQVLSRLMGKLLIAPPKRPKSNELWNTPKKFESFIIGYTDDGEPRIHNSNPDELANFFGSNPGQPHYLTPVHFRRDVLDKYYHRPDANIAL